MSKIYTRTGDAGQTALFGGVNGAIFYFLGFRFYTPPLGFALTLGLLYVGLSFKRRRRINRFNEQLPDVLDIIVRSLRAGHPLPIALSLAGRELPDPAGTEFGIVSDEVTFGLDITAANCPNGPHVELWTCNGGTNQQCRATGGQLINPASGKCLDDPNGSTTNGTQLQIWSCSGASNQKWTVP